MKYLLTMVFSFLVICNLPVSTVNANDNKDEVSCNSISLLDSESFSERYNEISGTYSIDVVVSAFRKVSRAILAKEARPPTKTKYK